VWRRRRRRGGGLRKRRMREDATGARKRERVKRLP
jgi:hypothetical protein